MHQENERSRLSLDSSSFVYLWFSKFWQRTKDSCRVPHPIPSPATKTTKLSQSQWEAAARCNSGGGISGNGTMCRNNGTWATLICSHQHFLTRRWWCCAREKQRMSCELCSDVSHGATATSPCCRSISAVAVRRSDALL